MRRSSEMNVPRGRANAAYGGHSTASPASQRPAYPRTPTRHLSAEEARRYREAAHAASSVHAQLPLRRIAVACCVVLALCGVGGAFAWFSSQDGVLNTFTRGKITPTIEETFDASATVKKDVFVTNKGTAPAYMRATVSVYWEDSQGNQLWEAPVENTDYKITWGSALSENANPRWMLGADGYCYWSVPVEPGQQTANLIDSATQSNPALDKKLVVDISTQALQAGMSAGEGFDKVWSASSGLKVGADGMLVKQTAN